MTPVKHRIRSRGLSLIEVVVSSLLVGAVLVVSLNCLGSVISGRLTSTNHGRGPQLAQQLMTEILNTAYLDAGGAPVFGLEAGESGMNRLDFDDVDDFHGWSANPPQHRSGNVVINSSGWQRDVTVVLANPVTPSGNSASDLGLKRITVTVRHNGNVVTQLVAVRSDQYFP